MGIDIGELLVVATITQGYEGRHTIIVGVPTARAGIGRCTQPDGLSLNQIKLIAQIEDGIDLTCRIFVVLTDTDAHVLRALALDITSLLQQRLLKSE